MSDFEKAKKNLKNDMLFLFVLELILVGFSMYAGQLNVFAIIYAIFLLTGYFLAKSGSKSAGTVGMIVGVLMMLTILSGDLLDFLLGLFLVMHTSKYNKLVK